MAADAEPVWPQPARALRVRAGHVPGTGPRLLGQPCVIKAQSDDDARAERGSTGLADQMNFKSHSRHLPRRWPHWDSAFSCARTPATGAPNDDSPGLPSDAALGHDRFHKASMGRPVAVSACSYLTDWNEVGARAARPRRCQLVAQCGAPGRMGTDPIC